MLKKELEALLKKKEGQIKALEKMVSDQRVDLLEEDDKSDDIIKALKDQLREACMDHESALAWRNVWGALLIVSVILHFFI